MTTYDANMIKLSAVVALTVFTMVKSASFRRFVYRYAAVVAINALKGIVGADKAILRCTVAFFVWMFDYAKYCQPRPLVMLGRLFFVVLWFTNATLYIVVYVLYSMY